MMLWQGTGAGAVLTLVSKTSNDFRGDGRLCTVEGLIDNGGCFLPGLRSLFVCPAFLHSPPLPSSTHVVPCSALPLWLVHHVASAPWLSRVLSCLLLRLLFLPAAGAVWSGEERDGFVAPRAGRRGLRRLCLRVAVGGVSGGRRAARRCEQVLGWVGGTTGDGGWLAVALCTSETL